MTGGAVVCSQYNGRRDTKDATYAAGQLETVLFIFSMAAAFICAVFGKQMLPAIFGSVEDSVMHSAWIYMFVTALSYPFLEFIMREPPFSEVWETARSAWDSVC